MREEKSGIVTVSLVIKCLFVAVAAISPAHLALGSILVNTFSGVGSGTITGNPSFTNAPFTITYTLNTTAITSPAPGYYEYSGVSGAFTEGSFNATLTSTTAEVNGNPSTGIGNFEDVFLFNSTFGSSIGISQDATLLGYTLATAITTGVITGSQAGAFQDATGFTESGGFGSPVFALVTTVWSLGWAAARADLSIITVSPWVEPS